MNERERLNRAYLQQAAKFAENFAIKEKQEFLQEMQDRFDFEQQKNLQKNMEKQPLARFFTLLCCILFFSFLFYWQTGRYTTLKEGKQEFIQFQAQAEENFSGNERYILNLQKQLRENPNDGDLWFELAQAYALDNDFESALICYDNAEKVLGDNAAIYGGRATAEYYRNKHQITPTVKNWIEKALVLNPNENTSLLLLASDAFLRNDFENAIKFWEMVLNEENPTINRREIIRSLNMAKSRLNRAE